MIWWSHAWNINSKESKPIAESDTSTPIFIAVLFSIAKVQTQEPKCPFTDDWIKI